MVGRADVTLGVGTSDEGEIQFDVGLVPRLRE